MATHQGEEIDGLAEAIAEVFAENAIDPAERARMPAGAACGAAAPGSD